MLNCLDLEQYGGTLFLLILPRWLSFSSVQYLVTEVAVKRA